MKMTHIGHLKEPSADHSLRLEHCREFNSQNFQEETSQLDSREQQEQSKV